MRTLLIAIIASVCWLAPSYGQNSGKSAKEVWAAFEANPSDMYIFLDGLADSDNPQGYKRYISDFVSTCLNRGVDWDALFDEMKETILPKDSSVASIFCAYLVEATEDLSKKSKVVQALPKSWSSDDDIYLGKRIKIIPGGMLWENYGQYSIHIDEDRLEKMNTVLTSVGNRSDEQLLCLPDGTMKCGEFKEDNPLELYIGYTLNNQGEIISETCTGYGSFDKAINSIKKQEAAREAAREAANGAAFDKFMAQQKVKLVKRYGIKAYNAMDNAKPYVGMPEGILRDFCYMSPSMNGDRNNDAVFHAYAFSHTNISGYKVYKKTLPYYSLCYATGISIPQYILCSGGKVAAIKW